MTDQTEPAPPPARIVIDWPDDGAEPRIAIEHCSWTQLYSAAYLLDLAAQDQRKAVAVQAAMERQAVASLAGRLQQRRT